MLKQYKPTSPGVRQRIKVKAALSQREPEKKQVVSNFRHVGRSKSSGRITVRHKGGGHKKLYRIIDFKRDKFGIPAKVVSIEYDPNRNCFISLLASSSLPFAASRKSRASCSYPLAVASYPAALATSASAARS